MWHAADPAGCGLAGAAVYTAYRDSDTIFSSKDLASGVYELWQKKGATNIAEVRIDLQQGLSSGVVPSTANMGAC
jgi:hypothetical protein